MRSSTSVPAHSGAPGLSSPGTSNGSISRGPWPRASIIAALLHIMGQGAVWVRHYWRASKGRQAVMRAYQGAGGASWRRWQQAQ